MNATVRRTVWALKRRDDGSFLFSTGCWMAPLIFSHRERARRAAREFREHFIECAPARIVLTVTVAEVQKGAQS